MTLHGCYTNKGRALAAKIAGGTASLTITRVVAGSGHTADPASATSLPDTMQTLAVGSPTVSGDTATLPVTLAEVQAGSAYSLTELGVYATDPDEGEILFQVYQLDTAQSITAHGEGVLRFYLRQSIGAQGVTVTCSPAGLVTDGELAPVRSMVMATSAAVRSVTVAPAELQAYLDAMPRLVTEDLSILITGGTVTQPLELKNFYGSGRISIEPAGAASVTVTAGISLTFCSCAILIKGLNVAGSVGSGSISTYAAQNLFLSNVVINGADKTGRGLSATNNSLVYMGGCTVRNTSNSIFASSGSVVSVRDLTAGGNTNGGYVYSGGIIMLSGSTPDTMGGSCNLKGGGIIVKSDGTLL